MLCDGEPMTQRSRQVFLSEPEHQLTVNAPVLAEMGFADPLCTSLIESVVNAAIRLHNEIWIRSAKMQDTAVQHRSNILSHTCTALRQGAHVRATFMEYRRHLLWFTIQRPADAKAEKWTGDCLYNFQLHENGTHMCIGDRQVGYAATAFTMMSATRMRTPTLQTGPTDGTSTPLPQKA